MKIIYNSIRVIDYINEIVNKRNTPDTFNEYVIELITHINNNESVRTYKTLSNSTEIISCILNLLQNNDEAHFIEKSDIIANRLLRTEKEAQNRISRMHVDVKKGSLIQALLFDEMSYNYYYLLAKVEHGEFVDDFDYSFKTGFSKDKKTIWKSCLIDLSNPSADVFNTKVYSDTKAKYWSHDFLELKEIISDETNTLNAYKAINEVLNRNIKKEYKQDYTVIRNSFISYIRNNEYIDYHTMVDSIIGNYLPFDLNNEKLADLKIKLYELPQKKHFDRQFTSASSAITAKIGKTYKVHTGIEVKITEGIPNLLETIKAFQAYDGTRYLQIKITDNDTYESFKSTNNRDKHI